MKLFKKVKIERCEFQKNINLDGELTRLRLFMDGWGFLKISSETHPKWVGIRKFIKNGDKGLAFLVPKNSIITIKIANFFGHTKHYYKSPGPDFKFQEIPKPLTLFVNKTRIDNIKKFIFNSNYNTKIFNKFFQHGANIKRNNVEFKLNLKRKNLLLKTPKFTLNKKLIKQKLSENSIKI